MKHQLFANRSVIRFTAFVALVLAAGAATQAQTLTVLHSFTNSPDGAVPVGELLRNAAGTLYGTTLGGGGLNSSGTACGTVFKLDPADNETILSSSGQCPGNSYAGLVMDAGGNLYGTSRDGGAFGLGSVFRLDASGRVEVLHRLTGAHGRDP